MWRVAGEWRNDRTRRAVRLVQVKEWRVEKRAGDGDSKVHRATYDTEAEARTDVAHTLATSGDRWRDLTEVTAKR